MHNLNCKLYLNDEITYKQFGAFLKRLHYEFNVLENLGAFHTTNVLWLAMNGRILANAGR